MNRSSSLATTFGPLAGVGFAFFFFASIFIFNPLRDATDQELLAHWSDAGKQRDNIISMYSMLLATPLFLIFLAALRQRLQSAGGAASEWSGVVFGAGLAFVALVVVTAFSRGFLAQAIRFNDEPIPGPDTLRLATAFSQAALSVGAMPFAAVTVMVASIVIIRTGALDRWLGWLGIVAAILTFALVVVLAGAFAIPLICLWTVAASFVIWRGRDVAEGALLAPSPGARGAVVPPTGG